MENQSQRQITTNRKLYDLDAQYKQWSNLVSYIDEAQNYYNGDQMPKGLTDQIYVTMNICSFSAQIKASKVCGTPIYLTFTSDNDEIDCTALRQFDEYNCNKLHLSANNYQAALNGFVNGTEITFIRWDDDDTSYKGIYKGGLVEEHIDLRNFAVANPWLGDIQNQAWVMFWEEYPVGALKEMVEGKNDKEKQEKKDLIDGKTGANEAESYKEKEYINHALTTLYTRFFRVDGEVYFMCSTDTVDLFTYPHPLSRKVGKEKIKAVVDEYIKNQKKDAIDENGNKIPDYNIDYEDLIMSATSNEKLSQKQYGEIKEKFSLYPFAVFRPFAINRSFYGRSDIKGLIQTQNGINFMLSMMLMCAQNNAYNKIIVKPEALQGQTITNEPSQVLVDYSGFTNGWGIKFAESQPMPNGLLDFTDRLLAMTRVVYGFNDVMDGSVTNKDMSGYMLQQMIKQANTSIEQQQQLFWLFNEDKAAIRLLYYKHYVEEAKYVTELTDAEYDGEEQARERLHNTLKSGRKLETLPDAKPEDFEKPTHRARVNKFDGRKLYGTNFDISIEAMQGLADSKLVEQQTWDNLLLNNGLAQMPPENLNLYLQCAPNISPRTKAALKNVVRNLEQSRIRQLETQLKETMTKAQQIMTYAQYLENVTGYQGKFLKNMEKEFSSKINAQNKIIGGLTKDLDQYRGYANGASSDGQVKSDNARGIGGGHAAQPVVQ